ncbi:hypothetical protein [Aliikangiella maris]|uniref:Uncharacterized protein n=2 Tax=Aliikangiella maris TaxID=3162458 RepID=A0ABV3MUZ6_9GAMM
MKQFLRYQISGTVFILWLVIFFFGKDANNLNELITLLIANLESIKIIAGLAVAMPTGVIIHQFSVLIKNWGVSKIWSEYNDFPDKDKIPKFDYDKKGKTIEYCLERISNLNSFYYVRVDNGFLSPFMAWLVVGCCMGRNIDCTWTVTAIVVGLLTVVYLKRITSEINQYQSMLNDCTN